MRESHEIFAHCFCYDQLCATKCYRNCGWMSSTQSALLSQVQLLRNENDVAPFLRKPRASFFGACPPRFVPPLLYGTLWANSRIALLGTICENTSRVFMSIGKYLPSTLRCHLWMMTASRREIETITVPKSVGFCHMAGTFRANRAKIRTFYRHVS
jgi:hypothetical protein